MTSYTITWGEVRGVGHLTARNESGDIVRRVACDDPIDAGSDSASIASQVLGDLMIFSVDHDRETIHVAVES